MRRLLHRRPFLVTLPTVGVRITDMFVSVAISGSPVRITGVYRRRLDTFVGEDRRAAILAAATEAHQVLRVPEGTPAVLVLPPVASSVHLQLADGWSRQPLPVSPDPEGAAAVEEAGFAVDRFDVTPAALGRFASCSERHQGHIRTGGWAVRVSEDALTAASYPPGQFMVEQTTSGADWSMPDLYGVRLPDAVRRHLSVDLDAATIGAALRAFWFQPDLLVDVAS